MEPEEATIPMQQLGKQFNTHATAEELLDTVFPMSSMAYQRKIGDSGLK
jgi:hypothetical protein